MTMRLEVADTVSRKETTGSEMNLGSAHEILLEILQANLEVELAGAGDDVLASLLDLALDHGIGLGQALETLHELGKVLGVLALHGDANNGGDGEFHRLEGVSFELLFAGDGGVLGDELVQADARDGVTRRHGVDGILAAAHAQHGALDGLDVEILLFAWDVVRAEDTNLLASLNGTGEHAAEREETALVRGGDHLGDVQHEGTVRV